MSKRRFPAWNTYRVLYGEEEPSTTSTAVSAIAADSPVAPAVELEERMPTGPYDFPALSYEKVLEIRDHVSRIVRDSWR